MNAATSDANQPIPIDVRQLKGRVVLVRSSRDHRNPPTAMRGSIEIQESLGGPPKASVAVEFPQMFSTRAHHRNFPLDDESLKKLIRLERDGTFEFTIDEELS